MADDDTRTFNRVISMVLKRVDDFDPAAYNNDAFEFVHKFYKVCSNLEATDKEERRSLKFLLGDSYEHLYETGSDEFAQHVRANTDAAAGNIWTRAAAAREEAADWLEALCQSQPNELNSHFHSLLQEHERRGKNEVDWVMAQVMLYHGMDDQTRKANALAKLRQPIQKEDAVAYVSRVGKLVKRATRIGAALSQEMIVYSTIDGLSATAKAAVEEHIQRNGQPKTLTGLGKVLREVPQAKRKPDPGKGPASSAGSNPSNGRAKGKSISKDKGKGSAEKSAGPSDQGSQRVFCYNCGRKNHNTEDCLHKEKVCWTCKKSGHQKAQCPNRRTSEQQRMIAPDSADPQGLWMTCTLDSGEPIDLLVDTGATVSVVSPAVAKNMETTKCPQRTFKMANGTKVRSTKRITVTLSATALDGSTVKYPLEAMVLPGLREGGVFGLPDLAAHGIVVDCSRQVMTDQQGHSLSLRKEQDSDGISLVRAVREEDEWLFRIGPALTEAQKPRFTQLIGDNEDLFSGESKYPTAVSQFEHRIPLKDGATPYYERSRRCPEALKEPFKEALDEMEEKGLIRKQPSRYGCPAQPLLKGSPDQPIEERGLRIVIDYRGLNKDILIETHNTPRPDEILQSLHGKKVFSKVDARAGFYAVKMAEEDVPKTGMTTPWGTYVWLRMPMGLSNSPFSFQRYMESLIPQELLGVTVFVFLDDILFATETEEEHMELLARVLPRLREGGLTLNDKKCAFFTEKIGFLGFTITGDGLLPDQDKVEAINQMKSPKDKSEVRTFLGMIQYYSRFIPDLGRRQAPLSALTRKGVVWNWGPRQEEAFQDLKDALVGEVTLHHIDWDAPIIVETDGSRLGLGACMTQTQGDGTERPVMFVSRATNSAERNYSASELEMLAVIMALRKWRYALIGRHFTLRTDHAALTWLFKNRASQKSGKLDRWALTLQEYSFTTVHRAGVNNGNADCLSRLPTDRTLQDTAQEALEDYEFMDQSLGIVRTGGSGSESTAHSLLVIQELGTRELEEIERDWVFKSHIDAGHAGARRTVKKANAEYGPIKDVWRLAKQAKLECETCQVTEASGAETSNSLGAIKASRPRERVAIDFIGPFIEVGSDGQDSKVWALTVQDAYSGFLEAKVVSTQTAGSAIRALKQVFSQWGSPGIIQSDNGQQFVASEFEDFLTTREIEHTRVTTHLPQANGQIERSHKTLKKATIKYMVEGLSLREALTRAVEAQNTTYSSAIGTTPFQAFYGQAPESSVEPVVETPEQVGEQVRRTRAANQLQRQAEVLQKNQATSLKPGHKVLYKKFRRNKMSTHWIGPYTVVQVWKGRLATIAAGRGARKQVHVHQLKRYHGKAPIERDLPGAPLPRAEDFTIELDDDDNIVVGERAPDSESEDEGYEGVVDHRLDHGYDQYRRTWQANDGGERQKWMTSDLVPQEEIEAYWRRNE